MNTSFLLSNALEDESAVAGFFIKLLLIFTRELLTFQYYLFIGI
jgi:hypothetical protein